MIDRGIEAFLAVASCGTISGAAEMIHVTQPAVSHRIRELESFLGMILIDRMRGIRRCDLTPAGEAFLATADLWSKAWHETQKLKSDTSALSLNVGCVDSVSTFLLPRLYRGLIAHRPPVHLRIHTMRSLELYEKVERRERDVAFVLAEQCRKNVEVFPFYREPMLIVRPRQKSSQPHTIHANDLDPNHELFLNWGPWYQSWHDRMWSPHRNVEIELDSVTLIHELLRQPKQWAIVPFSVLDLFRKNKMVVQELIPRPPDRITYLITHRFPRIAARQGLEILASVARAEGFLESKNTERGNGEEE